ncbi:MAG: response regulator [Polyangiaceae bacterium]|nr:response regulator [Polyangiaceae bacterium]
MTKVLVFESEPAFAWELRTELGRLGCTVQIVDDGNAGLQMAASDRPDLILLSIELPRMNGFSVCNKLKKDPQLKDVPLIIMSSESSEETFEQHRRLKTRAEDYVRKPIALGELVGHIRQLVPISAEIEPEAILIDDAVVFDDEVEDLAAEPEVAPAQEPRKANEPDHEIDDFLGGAFDRLLGDEEPKPKAPAPQPQSLALDPPTIPAPPPPAPPPAPVVLAPLPPPPPPPPARASGPGSIAPARMPSVPPPPRSVATKGPVTTRSAPPAAQSSSDVSAPSPSSKKPSALAADASIVEQLRIDLARSAEELVRSRDEISRLTLALDASRASVQLLEAQEAAPREEADEVVRLRREVEELKAKLAVAGTGAAAAGASRGGSSRELLDLREALNKKDKEILALRDQLTSKDKELLELRDSTLALERDKADLSDRVSDVERTAEELAGKVDRYREERDYLSVRAENFEGLSRKLETKLASQAADAAARVAKLEADAAARVAALEADAAAAAAARDEAVAAERKAKDEALASLDQARQGAADAEARIASEAARYEAERERLISEHSAQIASLDEKHAAGIRELVEKHATEIRALQEAHAEQVDAAHETEIAGLRQEHATEVEQLTAKHAAEVEAVRADKQQAIDALSAQHAAKVEALTLEADERLAARNREFADEWVRGAAELEALHAQAVKQAEHDAAEKVRSELVEHYENKLRMIEGKHATDIETLRNERDRALADLDAASRSAVQELDRHVIALGADLQDTRIKLEETEEQRAALDAEVVRLKGELEAQRANVERLEAELQGSKAEASTLGAEKDRFVAEAVATASRIARMRARWEQDRLALEHTREALTQAAARLQEIESTPMDAD